MVATLIAPERPRRTVANSSSRQNFDSLPLHAPTPIDRRTFARSEMHADLDVHRVDHTIAARRQPHLTLALRDVSLGGMSAISPMPLDCGERLSLHMPSRGTVGGWSAVGRVIRCARSAMGYRVAVEFDPLPAA